MPQFRIASQIYIPAAPSKHYPLTARAESTKNRVLVLGVNIRRAPSRLTRVRIGPLNA